MKFPSLSTAEGLSSLDQFLLDKSFVSGYAPSQADLTLLHQLAAHKTGLNQYTNIQRWVQTLQSYASDERGQFPVGELVEIDSVIVDRDAAVSSEVEQTACFFVHSFRCCTVR